jgi:cystathionine gamma-synthase
MDPSTKVVALGRPERTPGGPVNAPIELSATFHEGGEASYGRSSNSTWSAFEAALGGLEGGQAVAFASGLAAVAAVLEAVPVGGWVIVPGDAYNGTRLFLQDAASRGRMSVRMADVADTSATLEICASVASNPGRVAAAGPFVQGLLWLESPTNPLLAIADLSALIEGAHRLGLGVAVDNTFATPLLQRPLELGADVVVHSVTKSLSGHSDLLMGAAVTNRPELADMLQQRRILHGGIPGPVESFLALRGIRTLDVRLQRAQANALELAARLASRAGVFAVRYPGLPDHPGHDLAKRQMSGFGTMIAFEVAGGLMAADAVCAAVELVTVATSLGGVETLMERRARVQGESHLPPGLLRLSVGIEHVDDLWADLDQAMRSAGVGA